MDEISTRTEEDWLHRFLPAQLQPCVRSWSSRKLFIMDPVEAEKNRRRSLRNTRECARRQETTSKPGDKLEKPVLDRGGSKSAPNSLNNGDKPKRQSLDRGDCKRAPNRWNGDKPETSLRSRRQQEIDVITIPTLRKVVR